MIDSIRHLLWNVDRETIDLQKHNKFNIERVLKFGTPKEVRWLLATYTDTDIIQVIKSSRNLDRKTANFWASHYGIPLDEVRCLTMPLRHDYFY